MKVKALILLSTVFAIKNQIYVRNKTRRLSAKKARHAHTHHNGNFWGWAWNSHNINNADALSPHPINVSNGDLHVFRWRARVLCIISLFLFMHSPTHTGRGKSAWCKSPRALPSSSPSHLYGISRFPLWPTFSH